MRIEQGELRRGGLEPECEPAYMSRGLPFGGELSAHSGALQTIDLHYWPTPNGKKITILPDELGIPYNILPCDIVKRRPIRSRLPQYCTRESHAGASESRAH